MRRQRKTTKRAEELKPVFKALIVISNLIKQTTNLRTKMDSRTLVAYIL